MLVTAQWTTCQALKTFETFAFTVQLAHAVTCTVPRALLSLATIATIAIIAFAHLVFGVPFAMLRASGSFTAVTFVAWIAHACPVGTLSITRALNPNFAGRIVHAERAFAKVAELALPSFVAQAGT
jgi:hypothetical protein